MQIMATAKAQRAREVGEDLCARKEAGYELGRLLLKGVITERQHRGGYDFAMLDDAYRRLVGLPPHSPSAMDIANTGGRSLKGEVPAATIRRVANQHQMVQTALADAGRIGAAAVSEVCLHDRPTADTTALKIGLSALADFFKVPLDYGDEAD